MGAPYFHINPLTSRNRADRLIVDAIINMGKLMLKAPDVMVNNLKGIGVKPAVNMIQKFHVSYLS